MKAAMESELRTMDKDHGLQASEGVVEAPFTTKEWITWVVIILSLEQE